MTNINLLINGINVVIILGTIGSWFFERQLRKRIKVLGTELKKDLEVYEFMLKNPRMRALLPSFEKMIAKKMNEVRQLIHEPTAMEIVLKHVFRFKV